MSVFSRIVRVGARGGMRGVSVCVRRSASTKSKAAEGGAKAAEQKAGTKMITVNIPVNISQYAGWIAALASVVLAGAKLYEMNKPSASEVAIDALKAKPPVWDSTDIYIQRPEAEQAMEQVRLAQCVLCVSGPRGTGKSTLVQHTATEPCILLRRCFKEKDVIQGVRNALKLTDNRFSELDSAESLKPVFAAATKEFGRMLTIYLEVSQANDKETEIRAVAQGLRQFVSDAHMCSGIMVFSDASGPLYIPQDERYKHLVLGDYTAEEAINYLTTQTSPERKPFTEDMAKILIAQLSKHVSLRPVTVRNLANTYQPELGALSLDDPETQAKLQEAVQQFVAPLEQEAYKQAGGLLKRKGSDSKDAADARTMFKQGVKHMLDTGETSFERWEDVKAIDACRLIKDNHALEYNVQTDRFFFYSLQHRHAFEKRTELLEDDK